MANLAIEVRCARLGELLVETGLINTQQLQKALQVQQETGKFLGETLVSLGFISPNDLGPCLKAITGFPFIHLGETYVDLGVAHELSDAVARRMKALPFQKKQEGICVALADPLDVSALDELRRRFNQRILPYLALESDLLEAIERVYRQRPRAASVLQEMDGQTPEAELSTDELLGMAEDAPIVRLVNGLIQDAIAGGVSDIHIEPQETTVRVRFRQDGLLYDQMTLPRGHYAAVISRIKILAHMNIAERRRPQDGRFVMHGENGEVYDLRISTIPVIYGEKVVMRLLKKTGILTSPDKLGLLPEQRAIFDKMTRQAYGILLVTGPTGSGKTTTLYSILNRINQTERNISTIEDPVEYHLNGVNQMQVMPQIGITFASGLRALMRQDPDVIMVGEIRDKETAETAIQAALTGHLVLSTLHTNDAPGAIVRLQNMGIEPFLISSALIGVIGQRLVRTVCPHCRELFPPPPGLLDSLGIRLPNGFRPVLARGAGCPRCGGRGMRGRTALFELMPMSETLRQMALQQRPGSDLQRQAKLEGMITMREAGLRRVVEGITTPDELSRVLTVEHGEGN
jgi:type IV pilus assembly protein PilB